MLLVPPRTQTLILRTPYFNRSKHACVINKIRVRECHLSVNSHVFPSYHNNALATSCEFLNAYTSSTGTTATWTTLTGRSCGSPVKQGATERTVAASFFSRGMNHSCSGPRIATAPAPNQASPANPMLSPMPYRSPATGGD